MEPRNRLSTSTNVRKSRLLRLSLVLAAGGLAAGATQLNAVARADTASVPITKTAFFENQQRANAAANAPSAGLQRQVDAQCRAAAKNAPGAHTDLVNSSVSASGGGYTVSYYWLCYLE